MYPYNKRRGSIYRGRGGPGRTGGYRFQSAGDGQGGVWTDEMRKAEAQRRKEIDAAQSN